MASGDEQPQGPDDRPDSSVRAVHRTRLGGIGVRESRTRKLNGEIADFVRNHPPRGVDQNRLRRFLDALEAPCSRREENELRAVYRADHAGKAARAKAVVDAVEKLGLEPFHAPAPLSPIRTEEVHLICWLAIETAEGKR